MRCFGSNLRAIYTISDRIKFPSHNGKKGGREKILDK